MRKEDDVILHLKHHLMPRKTSLQDIADKLKLSKTTVSWTLSGQGDAKGVRQETQEKVRQCAKDMNYRPNLLARSLNTGLSNVLGLIIPDITDSFFSTIARQIELEAKIKGYSLMIASSESDQKREDEILSIFRDRQVDGIIIVPTQQSNLKIKDMQKEGYPITIIDRIFPELSINSVSVNNRQVSHSIVSDMIREGAHRVAFITTNPDIYTMRERYLGYCDALSEYGLHTDERLVGNVEFQYYEDLITHVIDGILCNVPDVDAFFFATHVLAMETFHYFSERGIPYNNLYQLGCIHATSAFRVMAPSIRVARMPVDTIGSRAVSLLIDDINRRHTGEPCEAQNITLDCTYPCDLSLFGNRK